ncbi:hypothetical protein V8V74_26880, partial [Niallia taxi]
AGVAGPTGATGVAGPTGATGASGLPSITAISFDQPTTTAPVTIGTETTLNTVTLTVTGNNRIKIDTSQQLAFVIGLNLSYNISFNILIRRNGTLIAQQTVTRSGAAGILGATERFNDSFSYVDSPPVAGSTTYTVSILTTTTTSVTTVTSEIRWTNVTRFIQ